MGNAKINYFASLATASALAVGISGLTAQPSHAKGLDPLQVRYERNATSPSNENIKIVIPEVTSLDIETRVSSFYSKLAAEQTDLEPHYANAILENLDFLYED